MLAILNSYFFFLFLTTLVVSNNLVLFFISWVGLNISLYGILLKSFNSYNKEMTLKYFVSGSIVTIFILVAILLYFMDFFTFNYSVASYLYFNNDSLSETSELLYVSKLQKIYYSLIVSALLFKLGAFPFHFYLVDMYQTLNSKETMFLYTIALKISIFFTLLKFLSSFWYLNPIIVNLLICSGFGSVFVSSFSILKQYKLSKFWAYSYLNSAGYTLVALASGIGAQFGEISFYSAKVYFFTYILVWFGILDFISRVTFKTYKNKIFKKLYYVSDLTFLSNSLRISKPLSLENVNYFKNNLSYYFSTLIVSLLGLPPTLGFFSKAVVYFDLISNIQTLPVFVSLLALTPLVAFAYLKIIIYVLFSKVNNTFSKINKNVVNVLVEDSQFLITFEHVSKFIIISPILFFVFENSNYLNLEILKYFFIK